jgi:oligopeptide/dipeptide ABC transporter ATP-binding protein
LEVLDLNTHFHTLRGTVRAVDGVSLAIQKGEALGLVGESGCGKTMTAFSIMGLVPSPGKIVGGEIWFSHDNSRKDLTKIPEEEMRKVRGGKISMVFQDPMTYLNPVMRICDQIAEAIVLHQKVPRNEARRRAIELLEKVRIPIPSTIAQYYPHELSGGMRQRALIATAISCNPDLLIADEPTTALDVTVQAQVLELIKQLKREMNMALMLITHDLGIVADTCDRVCVMYAGRIVEEGDVYEIYREPRHPYTIGLLKSTLSIDEFKETLVTIEGTVPDLTNLPPGCRFRPRCSEVTDRCRETAPPMVEVKKGHKVSCWLYE